VPKIKTVFEQRFPKHEFIQFCYYHDLDVNITSKISICTKEVITIFDLNVSYCSSQMFKFVLNIEIIVYYRSGLELKLLLTGYIFIRQRFTGKTAFIQINLYTKSKTNVVNIYFFYDKNYLL